MWKFVLAAWAACLPALTLAAGPLATATVVDGDATLVRGTTAFALAEGVRLAPDDIVQTPPKGRFTRIEFADGLILDLGPDSRALLAPKLAPARVRPAPKVYLLQGVAKLSAPAGSAVLTNALVSPGFDVVSLTRDVVVAVTPDGAQAFAESGGVSISERRDQKSQPPLALKPGQFYARAGDAKPQVSARPNGAFVQMLPKAFLDTLPSRAERFRTRETAPKPAGPLVYADVQPWIDAEPAVRPMSLARWRGLVQQPEFRKALAAQMSAHPEWDRVVFPEKYRPKAAPGDTPGPGARR